MRAFFYAFVASFFVCFSAAAQELVDVNTATREQLEALPGIGAKTASDIVRERDENGPFGSVDDLNRVPSMTPSLLGKLKNLVKVGSGGSEQVLIQEGKVVSSETVRKVLKRYAGEPSVREVQDEAVAYANVHPEIVESWRLRSRTNALAPRLRTQGTGTINRDLRTVTEVGAADQEFKNEDNGGRLLVETTWQLDRLIFDRSEMNVAREAVRMANTRERILEEVTRRYFERRRLQIDLELSPPTDLADRVKKELRLQELTADIDAATGGWFGDKLKDAGRAPY